MNTFYHLHHQHHHHQEPILIVTATRTPCSWSLFSPSFIIYSLDLLKLINVARKAPCKRTQNCWPTTSKIVGCYMLRPFAHPVACCCMLFRKVWNRSNFSANNFQQCATMFDPFAQLFQHCWGHARSLRMVYKDLWVLSFPRCTAGPNIVGATMLGVVASVCTQPKN